jgi:hypothetical protein
VAFGLFRQHLAKDESDIFVCWVASDCTERRWLIYFTILWPVNPSASNFTPPGRSMSAPPSQVLRRRWIPASMGSRADDEAYLHSGVEQNFTPLRSSHSIPEADLALRRKKAMTRGEA